MGAAVHGQQSPQPWSLALRAVICLTGLCLTFLFVAARSSEHLPRGHRCATCAKDRKGGGGGDRPGPVASQMVIEFRPGDVLRGGRYEVQRRLRAPGDKSVYLGYDRKFDCAVTIDVFTSDDLIMSGGLSVAGWETQVLGKLGSHPNIAKVVDHWEDNEAAIMVSRLFPADLCWISSSPRENPARTFRLSASWVSRLRSLLGSRHAVAWCDQRWGEFQCVSQPVIWRAVGVSTHLLEAR
jgi:hypothetical protein